MTLNVAPELRAIIRDIRFRLDQLERRQLPDSTQFGPVAGGAFIIVASDGTGDFISIATAIASIPTGATNLGHLIYVKSSTTAYDDSALTSVDIGGRNITIIGPDSGQLSIHITAIPVGPKWTFKFLDNTSGSLASLRIIGLNLVPTQAGSAIFRSAGTTSGNIDSTFEHCYVNGGVFGSVPAGKLIAEECFFSTAVFTQTVTPGSTFIDNCRLDGGLFASSAVITLPSEMRVSRCRITQTASATCSFGNLSGEQDNICELIGNRWLINSGTPTLTFNKFENGDVLHVEGNSKSGANILTFAIAIGSSGGALITFQANVMKYTDITITEASGAQSEGIYISGVYRAIACAATGVNISATLDLRNTSSITALTISGNNNSAVVGIVAGTTSTGVVVTGNNNIITAPNRSACTTPLTNSGTGNTIN